ncbi:hypothetical protein [uncultured Shewanella sp.]|uniref:hypothetical protein n=1 Tax=uncultured Shewanella sp. TaxID=173975 RepID=UPI002615D21C|nr:hypothetical protein [uncultured Shewanella sp.]
MSNEHLEKQQKYTRKLQKAINKFNHYDLLGCDTHINDERQKKRCKYLYKITKYQKKLTKLKLTLQQVPSTAPLPYFKTVLSVTRYAWQQAELRQQTAIDVLSQNKQAMTSSKITHQACNMLNMTSTVQSKQSILKTALTNRSSNDTLMGQLISPHHSSMKSRRCKNCPALKKLGACRCENKQQQAS